MANEIREVRGPMPETPEIGSSAPTQETSHSAPSPSRQPAPARTRTARGVGIRVVKGMANLVFMALTIYLTYFFTIFFSTKPPAPAPVPESTRAAVKKIEELRAEERKLLTTYGPVNPATSTLRIPVDRAMELMVSEGTQPARPAATAPTTALAPAAPKATTVVPKAESVAAAPKPGTTAPVAVVAPAPPAAAPAPAGMPPVQLYRAICIACHDADGRGNIVRKAMPMIPDLTDAKWQATRTDADLLHSVLEGKGQFMLPMKDKFALARTDPKEMVAFMRSFQTGNPLAGTAAPAQLPGTPAAPAPTAAQPSVALGSTAPTSAAPAVTPPSTPVLPVAAPAPAAAPIDLAAIPLPAPLAAAPATTPASSRMLATDTSPERAARLREASGFYNINCIACHGPDGRGSAVRLAMPAIPDFTLGEWQSSHETSQLSVSILDGKGVLMPPWRGKVTPDQAKDLVAFIRGFGPPGLVSSEMPVSQFGTRIRKLRQQWQELDREVQALSSR
jgi:mono/diheme cytochrome c family protein